MKIVHTSDWRLGQVFPDQPERARELRAERLAVVDRLIALAESEAAAALLVAGNVFADNLLGRSTVASLAERLARSRVPVLLLPGQLDPLTPDSPYLRFPDLFRGPVRVLADSAAVPLGDRVLLFPLPVLDAGARPDFGSSPAPEGHAPRIAMLCSESFVAAPSHFSYVACGGRLQAGDSYPGTPEPLSHEGGGHALVVELGGAPVRRQVGRMHWVALELAVHSEEDCTALAEKLASIERAPETLLRLTLEGMLPADGWMRLTELVEGLRGRFFHVEIRDRVLPSGSFQTPVLQRLAERLAGPLNEGDEAKAEVARYALRWLARASTALEGRA